MDPITSFSEKHLPPDIQRAIAQHSTVLRMAYAEIASGINRLLNQGIPKEVISQVLQQAVDALAEQASASPRRPRNNSSNP